MRKLKPGRPSANPENGPAVPARRGRRTILGLSQAAGRLRFAVRRRSIVLVAIVMVVMLSATIFGLLDALELGAVNWAFRRRGPQPPASPVVIVAIDDLTFRFNGLQWPWPRTYFAQIVDRLVEGGAKVIAFDVFFFEPEDAGKPATYTIQDETLAEIARRYGVTEEEIQQASGLERGESLNPGVLLQIPVRGPLDYVVKAGDTVAAVAALYQVNPLAVVDATTNEPAHDPLGPGQSLEVLFGDGALAASLKAARNVVLDGDKHVERQAGFTVVRLNQPLPELLNAAAGFGLANVELDDDGAVHDILAWDEASEVIYYSWPIVAASYYRGRPLDGQPGFGGFTLGGGDIPLHAQRLRVNFRGPEGTIPTYSALQVVNGDLPLETFKDKIVLIGATVESLHDTYATPFKPKDPTPGVEIMANALDTVLSGQFIHVRSGVCPTDDLVVCLGSGLRAPSLLGVVLNSALALVLSTIRQPIRAVLTLLGLMVAGALAWLAAFIYLRTELPFVVPEATLFLGFVIPSVERAVSEELEKRRVRGIFELFISPEMVGQLIEQGIDAMRGQRAELSILFSDIRGFTTMSEQMTPEQLVELLNEYLGAMTDVVHRNGGTVDKYEGDLVMAFFGAPVAYPDHAQRAAQTSIEMRQELERLRAKWAGEGKPSNLEMGIGLNTGEVFVGLVGSGKRVNYTVMGDAVNLASRLQDLTKDLAWPLLVSEFTFARIQDEFDAEFAEARLVKGKTVPVRIYKVLGRKGAPASQRVRPLYADVAG